MSEVSKDAAPKKMRLGRGLGSLLSGGAPQSRLQSEVDFQSSFTVAAAPASQVPTLPVSEAFNEPLGHDTTQKQSALSAQNSDIKLEPVSALHADTSRINKVETNPLFKPTEGAIVPSKVETSEYSIGSASGYSDESKKADPMQKNAIYKHLESQDLQKNKSESKVSQQATDHSSEYPSEYSKNNDVSVATVALKPVASENPVETKAKAFITAPMPLDNARIWQIEVHKVRPNATQPRQSFLKPQLEELAQSIREKGILQPITVRRAGQYFEIVAGERRWRAAQMAGLHEVPVIIRELNDRDTLELALIENIQRADLNAIEEAKAYQQLADRFQLTQAEIAQKVGKERSTVTNALRLLGLAAPVQQMVVEGQISMGHARALLTFADMQEQIKCARLVVEKGLSVRQVEKLAKGQDASATSEKTTESVAGPVDAVVGQIQDELQKLLGTKVTIDYADGKGKLSFHFHSKDEFDGIVDIIRLTWQK